MGFLTGASDIIEGANKIVGKFLPDKTKAQECTTEVIKHLDNSATVRHDNDMKSDSWLSKNIRPLTLIWIMVNISVFGGLSCFGIKVDEHFWQILLIVTPIVFTFYFASRGLEKFKRIK